MNGLWTKEGEKGFGQFIDDKLVFKNAKVGWALEVVDGFIATQAAAFIDNSYAEKLPKEFVPIYIKIGKVFEQYSVDKKLVLSDFITSDEIAVVIDGFIDIPKINDDAEAMFFAGVMKGIFDIVGGLIKKKK